MRDIINSDNRLIVTETGYTITSDNYKKTCEILNHRFSNKRSCANLFYSHMKNFEVSFDNHKKLATFRSSVNALKSLDIEDFLLFQVTLHKVLTDTSFEQKCDTTILPSYGSLIDF